MSFKQVVGQEEAIRILAGSIKSSRLPHALLFTGPDGVGKGLVAKELAKLLNCQKGASDPCDRCQPCKKIEGFNHPDVGLIEPTGSSIGIGQIRWLRSQINLMPYEGRYKVYIIKHADLMTEEAQNALLKTLEEPPGRSLLILVSSNPTSLLPTIRSRCQVLKFRSLDSERIKEVLTSRYDIKPDKAHFLAHLADGGLGKVISLQDEDVLARKNEVIDHVDYVIRTKGSIDWTGESKEEIAHRLEILIDWFRDLLASKEGSNETLINIDRKEELSRAKDRYSAQRLIDIIEQLNQTRDFIMQNVNPKIALDVMVRKLGE